MIKKDININLKLVSKKDLRFLYELLKERKPSTNISHRKMPTFNEHLNFVLSKPYSKWYIIFNKNKKIGSIYISKQDEIGLHIKNLKWQKQIAEITIKLLKQKNPRDRYLVNINPKNKKMLNFYENNGFKLIQHTFELDLKD